MANATQATTKPLVFAYYVTGHGLGHATRVVEVVRHLILAGHTVHVVTGAPHFVFTTEIQSPGLFIREELLDCGAVQSDALTVDRLASLQKYSETAVVSRASILTKEVKWLKSIKADLVVSDVVPVVCRAAVDAGIRAVCVTNFSWDFIYAEYVMAAGYHNRSIVWQIAEDYSHCEFVIRLPGFCPMPAFRDVIDVPLVVRRLHKSREEVRKELGIGDNVKLLLFNFGGQPAGWKLQEDYLPAGWICLVCGLSSEELPPNFRKLPKDVYTPDLMAASDCMLGKIGYGAVSEALVYKLPFVFVRRDHFNEEPFLRNMLEFHQGGVEMIRRDLLSGNWGPYIEHAISLRPNYNGEINGGEVVARILQDTALGKSHASNKARILNALTHGVLGSLMHRKDLMFLLSGSRRLQDAIILGYQLQSVSSRDIYVPNWHSHAQNELGFHTEMTADGKITQVPSPKVQIEEFQILHGDHHGLPDTLNFLKRLAELAASGNADNNNKHTREFMAAAAMFNWEEEIFVARAPGRLDVVGGIADYSGSLVLQMPIKEGCHVAVQRNHPRKQKLWKHTQARQHAKGQGPTPVVEIVSFGSELSNRGPTFDMDLVDFMDGEQPISYEKAYQYFARDPSQKWAAYVAGAILVLMTELGVQFEDSMSILVMSAVPEGKGVSSSAAVEVSTMFAIAAAYGLNIPPRDIALLCQKVENHIVGAPCGVMDQMASACGEANKLLAMVCQPAEVLGLVEIPPHIKFWGFDSGIRHSVGGGDYGSVRVGAFMGKKMIKTEASELLKQMSNLVSPQCVEGINSVEMKKEGKERLEKEASIDYLCNLSPHRYEALYVYKLPESILGEEFIKQSANHEDKVTVINKKRNYSVRASTRHPIYENFRVKAFKALLTAEPSDDQLSALGELMYQCHYSYEACGLGSDGTNKLVELVQELQHGKTAKSGAGTLCGAKITGGGSGGTVCVIGRNCLESSQQIFEIQQKYRASTSYLPYVIEGSSPGAGKFGYLKLCYRYPSKSI